ncbi:MAG TPA: hypothetical protein VIK51_14260 [Vicinamibacteria bacterium]|jgi:hypothetical protein
MREGTTARRAGIALCVSMAASAIATLAAEERSTVGSILQTFALSDQFDDRHVVAFPHDRPTLLCIADRKSSGDIGAWTRRIHKELPPGRCRVVGLAVIKGVPFFLRGMIQGYFQKSGWVLMDWGGRVAREAGARSGACQVVLVDGQGVIRHVVYGPVDDKPFEELMAAFAAVETAAAPNPPSPPSSGRAR